MLRQLLNAKTSKQCAWVVAVLLSVTGPLEAIDLWQAGTQGLDWDDIGQLDGLAITDGSLGPAAVNPATNALRNIRNRNGSIRSPQSRDDLTSLLTDGNPETSWRVTRERRPDGTSMVIDLGAILPINRVRIEGNEDDFLRAYDLFVHDGNPEQLRNGLPVAYTNLVNTNLEQDDPIIDVDFPLQFVRFIRLISRSSQEFIIGDVEVFGDGFAPAGSFVSQVIDLGEPANFGKIRLALQAAEATNVVLQTRSGIVPDPRIFYRKTDLIAQGEEREEEIIIPIGFPEAEEAYGDLRSADRGRIEDNVVEWSPWSAPYEDLEGNFISPGNRQYVQFRLFFSSQDARQGAVVESFALEHSLPALAQELVAEITPAEVTLGETHTFEYFIRSDFSAGNPGFDRIQIQTPFIATLRDVAVDGVSVNFEQIDPEDQTRLTVQFTGNRITRSGQVVKLTFDALVTVYGTTFFAKVFDSTTQELGQDVVPGDASEASLSDRLAVRGRLRSELVLDLATNPSVFTPNGDNANDQTVVSFILLRALDPVQVRLTVFNLAGQPVRSLQDGDQLNGPQNVPWNGRDDQGNMLPPGTYIVRLEVDTDTGSQTQTRVVGLAY